MSRLYEWQKHVRTAEGRDELVCGTAWQPRTWYFESPEHARAAVAVNTCVQPCPECLRLLAEPDEPEMTREEYLRSVDEDHRVEAAIERWRGCDGDDE